MPHYYARPKHPKKDRNHKAIADQCRACGMVVWDLADVGGKVPDLLVVWRGRCLPVEVKMPEELDKLTQGEIDGMDECAYNGVDWVVATDLDDVLRAFGAKWEAL